MTFYIAFTPSARDDLKYFKIYDQNIILAAIKKFLHSNANLESYKRKRLKPNEFAPWELKVGKFRIFYSIEEGNFVKVVAVGYKEHNDLFIRGKKVEI